MNDKDKAIKELAGGLVGWSWDSLTISAREELLPIAKRIATSSPGSPLYEALKGAMGKEFMDMSVIKEVQNLLVRAHFEPHLVDRRNAALDILDPIIKKAKDEEYGYSKNETVGDFDFEQGGAFIPKGVDE